MRREEGRVREECGDAALCYGDPEEEVWERRRRRRRTGVRRTAADAGKRGQSEGSVEKGQPRLLARRGACGRETHRAGSSVGRDRRSGLWVREVWGAMGADAVCVRARVGQAAEALEQTNRALAAAGITPQVEPPLPRCMPCTLS